MYFGLFARETEKKITFFQNTHPANDINPAQVLGAGISVFLGISTSLFSTEESWDGFLTLLCTLKRVATLP